MLSLTVLLLSAAAVGLSLRPLPLRSPTHLGMAPVGLGPVAALLVLGVALVVQSVVLPIAVLQLSILGTFLVRGWRRRRNQRRLDDEVVTFVEDLSQQLRSGGVLASAFLPTLAGYPLVGARLESVASATQTGVRLEHALDHASQQQTNEGLRLLATSVAVLSGSGGPVATSLERLAQTLRDTASAREEAWAQASQALASAVVLAALPLLFAVAYALLEPDVVQFYLRTGLGGVCLVVMLGLITVGAVWVELAVRKV